MNSTSPRIEPLESERKRIQIRTQELQNLRNTRSKAIGAAKGKGEDVAALMAEVAGLADELKANEAALAERPGALSPTIALGMPNLPHESVPIGRDETHNVESPARRHAAQLRFRAARPRRPRRAQGLAGRRIGRASLSGARFTVLRGELARLHRALAQFMLDLHTGEHGYLEVNVPLMVHAETMQGTGQLPKFEEDLFATAGEHAPLPDPDRRGAADQPRPRQHPRGRRAAAAHDGRTRCASAPRPAATVATRAA